VIVGLIGLQNFLNVAFLDRLFLDFQLGILYKPTSQYMLTYVQSVCLGFFFVHFVSLCPVLFCFVTFFKIMLFSTTESYC
jgi:hypothetical protein